MKEGRCKMGRKRVRTETIGRSGAIEDVTPTVFVSP